MFSTVESMPAWQRGSSRQPTKPTTKQNVARASTISSPIQRTSNPSPRRNQTLLNSLSISVDRSKNPAPGKINYAKVSSKSCPISPWGNYSSGNTQSKSYAQAITNNPETSQRNQSSDRKPHGLTRLSGVTTRHQIERKENKLGNPNPKHDQPVLSPVMPSGYSHSRHFSGASHWQISDQTNRNQTPKPTRISPRQNGHGLKVAGLYAINTEHNTSYLEGHHTGSKGYTAYMPGKDGQSWKVSAEFKTSASPTVANFSQRNISDIKSTPGDVKLPRNSTAGSPRYMPFPKVSPYSSVPVSNIGGSPRSQSSLMGTRHKKVSPKHSDNLKVATPGTKHKTQASKSPFSHQASGALADMMGDSKRTENNKKITHPNADADTNSRPPVKYVQQKDKQTKAKSFRKVKSQLLMAKPKSKSLHAKDDSLKGSQMRVQTVKCQSGDSAHISKDEDSDEETWSKTIFDRGNLVKSAEKRMPHLLSGYQTLFPVVSPTCQTLPSVVTAQGDRQGRIPRRVKAHPHKRTKSPSNFLSRLLSLGGSASAHGPPLWRPIKRELPAQILNDNNNNCIETFNDHAEKRNSITAHRNNMPGLNSASLMRPYIDTMVSSVTSTQDVSLEELREKLKHSIYKQQYRPINKPESTVSIDILEQMVEDAISIVQAQRQAAAQKVTGILADLFLVSVERRRKQKKAETFQGVISKFWDSDI